jgi:hypothetical protein
MNARERFDQTLASFMHRKRTFLTSSAAVWASLACVVLALAFILIDIKLEFAVFWRWLALGSLLGTGALLLSTLWLYRILRYRRQRAIRELETVRSDLGQLLRTSDEMGDEDRARELGFSPALAEALSRQAGDEIESTPTETLLPWRTVRRVAAVLLLLVIAGIVMGIAWPDFRTAATRIALPNAPVSYTVLEIETSSAEFEREQSVTIQARVVGRPVDGAELQLRPAGQADAEWRPLTMQSDRADQFSAEVAGWVESFEFRVLAGRARTPAQMVRFIDPPRVEECTVTLVFPDYTQLPSRVVPLQRIVGVVGTKAQLHFRLNHGLVSGAISGPEGEIQTVPPNVSEFDFEVELTEGTTRYSMAGRDAEALALKPAEWKVRGVPDRPPTAKIEAPAENLRVTKLAEVPLDIRVADDYGIAEAGIVLTINGKEHRLVHRTFPDGNPRRVRLEYRLELERFGVEVNANVRLHAYVADRFPGREGRSVSGLRMVDIRPLKILYRLPDPDEPPMSSEEQQQLEEQLAKLDDAIKAEQEVLAETLREREERPKAPEPREELAKKQEQVAELLQALREQAQEEEATPEENDKHLEAALEQMKEAAKELRDPDVKEALKKEDEALAEMLRARNQLEQELKKQQQQQQQQQQQEEQKPPEPPPPLDDLAERAEELAKKEEAIAEQAQEEQQPQEQQAQAEQQPQEQQANAEQQPQEQQAQAEEQANAEQQPQEQRAQAEEQANAEQQPQEQQAQAEEQANAEQQAQAEQDPAKQQEQAVAEANELLEDVRQHPEATPLAEERMAEARDEMQKAAEALAKDEQQEAQEEMQEAQKDLERLAEHLKGLDQENVLETMEKARDKAEEAADRLEELAQQEQQPQDPQDPQQQQQQEQQAQAQQQPQDPQDPQDPQQQQAQAQAQQQAQNPAEQPQQAQTPAEQREEIAREAETLADWMKRMGETKTEDREKVAEKLNEARKELEAEQLPEDIREAAKDREEGREEQAAEQDRKAAERLREMAKTFEEERKELVKNQLERLAEAEAQTKRLAEEVEREATEPTPPKPGKPTTNEKLSELAEDYQELQDEKMEELGKRLETEVAPQNLDATGTDGQEVPKDVTQDALEPGARRLRQLIDEIVEREMLIDRDRRVPEEYRPLVDTYFKELSDDARE